MSLPVGPEVPRRGNAFSRGLARLLLRCMGWRIEGTVPDVAKMVLLGAPHTSNMDGVLAILSLSALGVRSGTMIKDSAFKGPMGPVLRWVGAIPVDRSSAKRVVAQSIEAFKRSERLWLLIAPEGTRSGAPDWKRGFYYIAHGARVPIMPGIVNYRDKTVTFGPVLHPTGDCEADLQQLFALYRSRGVPAYPERLSQPLR